MRDFPAEFFLLGMRTAIHMNLFQHLLLLESKNKNAEDTINDMKYILECNIIHYQEEYHLLDKLKDDE